MNQELDLSHSFMYELCFLLHDKARKASGSDCSLRALFFVDFASAFGTVVGQLCVYVKLCSLCDVGQIK